MANEVTLLKDVLKFGPELVGGAIDRGVALASDARGPGWQGVSEALGDPKQVLGRDAYLQLKEKTPEFFNGIEAELQTGSKEAGLSVMHKLAPFAANMTGRGQDANVLQPMMQHAMRIAGINIDYTKPGAASDAARTAAGGAGSPLANLLTNAAPSAVEAERKMALLPGQQEDQEAQTEGRLERTITERQTRQPAINASNATTAAANQQRQQNEALFPDRQREATAKAGKARDEEHIGRKQSVVDLKADNVRLRNLPRSEEARIDYLESLSAANRGGGSGEADAVMAELNRAAGRGEGGSAQPSALNDAAFMERAGQDPFSVISPELVQKLRSLGPEDELVYSEVANDLKAHGITSPEAIAFAFRMIAEALGATP